MSQVKVDWFPSGVLVVDDEPVILQLLVHALTDKGLQIKTAATAELGEEALAQQNFACLLVDKNLPGMDGLELMRRTRKLQPHCACVMMTGYSSVGSVVEALRLGAADYVEKPFPSLELVAEKVELAISNSRNRFERDQFLVRLRQFEAELKQRDAKIGEQRTEIEIFNDILEARVAAAVGDLQQRCDMLGRQLAANIGGERAAKLSAEMILSNTTTLEAKEEAAPVRGEIARLARQLEDHLTLLR